MWVGWWCSHMVYSYPLGALALGFSGWCRARSAPTRVFPSMPLVPFKLLLWCWSSEGVSLSKSLCGFFKRNCLGLQKFFLPTQSPLVFVARSFGDLSSWHWNPGLGVLVWGKDSSLLRYPSRIFIHHMWVWDQPVLHLHPPYQSGWMWFL